MPGIEPGPLLHHANACTIAPLKPLTGRMKESLYNQPCIFNIARAYVTVSTDQTDRHSEIAPQKSPFYIIMRLHWWLM